MLKDEDFLLCLNYIFIDQALYFKSTTLSFSDLIRETTVSQTLVMPGFLPSQE